MFYFNQFLHNPSDQFFKNLILIRSKIIESNYLYVYQTNFILKINHMNFFYNSWYETSWYKKASDNPK